MRLAGRVCYEPGLVVVVGLYWVLGDEVIIIVLMTGGAETGLVFS